MVVNLAAHLEGALHHGYGLGGDMIAHQKEACGDTQLLQKIQQSNGGCSVGPIVKGQCDILLFYDNYLSKVGKRHPPKRVHRFRVDLF